MAILHPILGGCILVLLLYAAGLGLQLRQPRRNRLELAGRHARVAPWVLGLATASWLFGVISTWLWRDDLDLASSFHFQSGTVLVLLLTGSAISARRMQRGDQRSREVHPWIGAAAVLVAAAQFATGLRMMQ